MTKPDKTVYEKRNYVITGTSQAKAIATAFLEEKLGNVYVYKFGLPEVDDRYHVWRLPVLSTLRERIGEIVLNARTGEIDAAKSSNAESLEKRLLLKDERRAPQQQNSRRGGVIPRSPLDNTIICGDSTKVLAELPTGSVDLVFTSPPYFNARPDYSEYEAYEHYLEEMRTVIKESHRLLAEGRFFVINVSPVLIRRTDRNSASKRIAVPFDLHRLFIEEDFDFIDDIIWEKPSGAGWATGRGRRFAADRNPLQYKAVPVTEYVLVYRKKTSRLIDWNIKSHHDPEAVKRSRIEDGYEQTNIWRISPSYSKKHPAIFPLELAQKVISYYSFEGDVVLDPFAGIGTTAKASLAAGRRFVAVELDEEYVREIRREVADLLGKDAASVKCIGCDSLESDRLL